MNLLRNSTAHRLFFFNRYQFTKRKQMIKSNSTLNATVNVRYIVDDVDAAVKFYKEFFGFEVYHAPADRLCNVTKRWFEITLESTRSGRRRSRNA